MEYIIIGLLILILILLVIVLFRKNNNDMIEKMSTLEIQIIKE